MRRRAIVVTAAAELARATEAPLRAALIDMPPFGGLGADGNVEGVFMQRLRNLSERSRLDIRPILLPYRRASQALISREADLTAVLVSRWIPGTALDLGPFMRLRIVALPRPGLQLEHVEQLASLRVTSLRGLAYELNRPDLRAEQEHLATKGAQMIAMLDAGRVDVAVGVAQTLDYAAIKAGWPVAFRRTALSVGEQVARLWARADLPAHQLHTLRATINDNLCANKRGEPKWTAWLNAPIS